MPQKINLKMNPIKTKSLIIIFTTLLFIFSCIQKNNQSIQKINYIQLENFVKEGNYIIIDKFLKNNSHKYFSKKQKRKLLLYLILYKTKYSEKRMNSIRILLKDDINLNKKTKIVDFESKPFYTFPLNAGVYISDFNVVKLILSKNVKLDTISHNIKNDNLKADVFTPLSPLLLTCTPFSPKSNSNLKILKLIIKKGASLNTSDYYGWNALHHAVDTQQIDIIKYLLKININKNLKSKITLKSFEQDNIYFYPKKITPIDLAKIKRNKYLEKYKYYIIMKKHYIKYKKLKLSKEKKKYLFENNLKFILSLKQINSEITTYKYFKNKMNLIISILGR